MKSIPKLLISEVLNPFYLFQIWSCALWYVSEYEYYATCILLFSVITVTFEVIDM